MNSPSVSVVCALAFAKISTTDTYRRVPNRRTNRRDCVTPLTAPVAETIRVRVPGSKSRRP
jgi:hypothetical protein